jgi:hypothetical protein
VRNRTFRLDRSVAVRTSEMSIHDPDPTIESL